MLLPQSTYCSEGVNFNVMMIMMRWCDDVMMWWCDDVMMWWWSMMMMMIMTIVSVEQRPGWGEHVCVLFGWHFTIWIYLGDISLGKKINPWWFIHFSPLGRSDEPVVDHRFTITRRLWQDPTKDQDVCTDVHRENGKVQPHGQSWMIHW